MEYNSFPYEIENLTKDDLLNNMNIYSELEEVNPITTRTQILVKILEKAKELKIKSSVDLLIKSTSKESKISFLTNDFDLSKIGDALLKDNIIKKFIINNYSDDLYMYNKNNFCYEPFGENANSDLFNTKIRELYPNIYRAQKREVIDYLKDKADKVYQEDIKKCNRYIVVGNGVLDLKTASLVTGDLEDLLKIYCTNRISTNYNESAESKLLDKTLNEIFLGNEKQIQFFYEFVGYCLYSGTEFNKMLIITGNGSNGKSVLLNLISKLLDGAKNCSYERLQDLDATKTRYATRQLYNKLVNIDDDSSKNAINDSSNIKNITNGDVISAEGKFRDSFYFNPKSTLIVAANDTATINDKSDGLARRLLVLPLKNRFIEGKNQNKNLMQELNTQEVLETLLFKATNCFLMLLVGANQSFTEDEEMKTAKANFLRQNNKTLMFIDYLEEQKSLPIKDRDAIFEFSKLESGYYTKDNVYSIYRDWAENMEHIDKKHILTRTDFLNEMQLRGYHENKAKRDIKYYKKNQVGRDASIGRPQLLFYSNEQEDNFYKLV